MAALFIRTMVASAVNPLRRLSRMTGDTAAPRALSTLPPGPPRVAVAAPLARQPPPFQPPALGFKTKAVLRKRCRDCDLVKRRGRWFIYCKTHPRHKQRQLLSK